VIDYSSNLEPGTDMRAVVVAVHRAALSTGVFELGAVRTRATRHDIYAVADEDPPNSFIAVVARMARGRDEETRKKVGKAIFDAICGEVFETETPQTVAVSVDIEEINPVGSFKQNGLHALMAERAALRVRR
jgi:5-carboxymethyl-2-hydroxymuconate isomerase